ncbi:membrane-associated phospholipid phosphatase [Methylobacterium brachythecii]|uniref:Membrane-associated phospholipid phosphatase n=1 Tax=Methylobacterium brachythecii TaxID=1176177 RepID=A0A7W6AP05_9HYPH|nr:phosphatase PAP2 family protein [Methylobacterium brachythecii]MBB3904799.1 membrane-associated phospholipid phosphatase [Methylobacterium brachythecii]
MTALGSATVLWFAAVVALCILALRGDGPALILVVAAMAGGQVLSSLLKSAFDRARPDLIRGGPAVFDASFPSGHAMMSLVTYLTLATVLARDEPRRSLKSVYLAAAAILTLSVGASRVLLGVHWPTDVLGGWCAGIAWVSLCLLAALAWKPRERTAAPA